LESKWATQALAQGRVTTDMKWIDIKIKDLKKKINDQSVEDAYFLYKFLGYPRLFYKMTFVFRHPNYYKKLKEQQASENDQELDNKQDKESTDSSEQDSQSD